MKKLFVTVLMMAATFSLAIAQGPQGGGRRMTVEERSKATVERVNTLVTLNADQKSKIEAIELDLNKQMDAKRQSIQGNREAMMSLYQEFDKVRDEKYKAVLTAEQFKKYSENKPQGRRQGGNGGGNGGNGGGQGRSRNN